VITDGEDQLNFVLIFILYDPHLRLPEISTSSSSSYPPHQPTET
jgi:hypothetical protein